MSGEDSSIPVISITSIDDTQVHNYKNPYQVSPEPLTDLEELDHEPPQQFVRGLKIRLDDEGGLTDAEVMDASDEEKEPDIMLEKSLQLDDIIEHGGTFEEQVRLNSPHSIKSKINIESSVSTSNSAPLGDFLKTFYEKDGTTDYEDLDLSDEEDNVDDANDELENTDFLHRLIADETVAITDCYKKSPVPTPPATPEPGGKNYYKKSKTGKKITSLKKKNNNLLSPRSLSPHLSDITDTEIVYSDSEEEETIKRRPLSPQERRRRLKHVRENEHPSVTKKDQADNILPELEISSVFIEEKVPVKELVSESDTDNTSSATNKHNFYAHKNKNILMEVAGALVKETIASTDVENFEGSNESINDDDDDAASQISDSHFNAAENQYGSVKDQEVRKDALCLPKQDKIMLTDTEDIETDEERGVVGSKKHPTIKILSHGTSTEEDDVETSEIEYLSAVKEMRARAWKESNYEIRFIEIGGKIRPLAITPDLPQTTTSLNIPTQTTSYSTDIEDLGESDNEKPFQNYLYVRSSDRDALLTDTEIFEGEDESYRPKSPEPSDDENSQSLPEPVREMILMKEDPSGRPVSVVLPLGNVEPDGLQAPYLELEGGTSEIEEMATDDDDTLNTPDVPDLNPTPDLPEVEGGIIHSSEVLKVQKKRLKILGQELPEPLTDTEDIFLSVSGKRKRSKPKLKLGLEPKLSDTKNYLTDTEEVILSDKECQDKSTLAVPQAEIDPATDVDDVDLSGEDEFQEIQRSIAVTPEHLRELGDSFTTLREGNGPFTEEAKQSFLSINKIPVINTISPSPDIHFGINTDTEDMFTSADEDGLSRAETMTPYDTGVELEDHSSFVYMKHTRKFDLDAPEEAMHIKGSVDIHETFTDVEDLGISEDERPKPPDQLFVNDMAEQVCVCLNSEVKEEDSVCVCVSKEHGGLSLVWNSKNSTDAKQHGDWTEKGKPDSAIDSSNKESEEALLDVAAGLQDNKESSSGPRPSDSK